MIIKSVELLNFRNHKRTILSLSPGINVLIGNNAQGKTNFLEAVYMTCVGRGFRSPRDREIIRFGEDIARVKTIAEKSFGKISVDIIISTAPGRTGKQIKINGIPIAKMGELLGTVTCVFFNPDELRLIKDSPADRRRFMDIDISQIDKVYFYNLLRYNKILKQRNALFKDMGTKPSSPELQSLDIWDEQLATAGEQIINRRILFCEELRDKAKSIHSVFAPGEDLFVEYETLIVPRGTFLEALKVAREKDMRLGTTTVGPHRDDILFRINDKDVRSFGSQGQQRTVALSLKIAELLIFEKATGEKPILLLDDVLSELDGSRQKKLLELIKGWQSIITVTGPNAVAGGDIKIFRVNDGHIV